MACGAITTVSFASEQLPPATKKWSQIDWDLNAKYFTGRVREVESCTFCGSLKHQKASIAPMELLPIVIAAAIWGLKWAGCTVRSNCDNEAVVSVINSGHCEHELMMHLVSFLLCS